MLTDLQRYADARLVDCDYCEASPGNACRSGLGYAVGFHAVRQAAAGHLSAEQLATARAAARRPAPRVARNAR